MGGRGVTAAILILDSAINESSKGRPEGVARFPNRFCSRDGNPWLRSAGGTPCMPGQVSLQGRYSLVLTCVVCF